MFYRRREPHNYDKIPPTQNQTLVYNHIISQQTQLQSQDPQQQQQQQQSQGSPQQNIFNTTYQDPNVITPLQHTSPIQTTTNNFNSLQNITNLNTQSVINLPNTTTTSTPSLQMHNISSKFLNQSNLTNLVSPSQSQTNLNQMQNIQNLIPILSMSSQQSPPSIQSAQNIHQEITDSYKATSSHQLQSQNDAYKPYPTMHAYKINSIGNNYNTIRSHMRHKSPPSASTSILNEQNNQQQTAKEMGRSQSLPLNAKLHSLQKEENFVVPKSYQTKPKLQRTRSNSMVIKQQAILPALQSATSEPLLSSNNSALLQQLLTTNNSKL